MPSTTRTKTKASGTPRASTATGPDAITLLRTDHKNVSAMFKQFDSMKGDGPEKQAVVDQICSDLTVHTTIEEEIFYPAVRDAIKDQDLLDEADVEHAGAKNLITELMKMAPGDDHYDAKVTVLSEYIKHHVKEEQEEMFPKIKLSKLDLKELGMQMQMRRDELAPRA